MVFAVKSFPIFITVAQKFTDARGHPCIFFESNNLAKKGSRGCEFFPNSARVEQGPKVLNHPDLWKIARSVQPTGDGNLMKVVLKRILPISKHVRRTS